MSNDITHIEVLIQGCVKEDMKCQEALYKRFYAYSKSICLRYTKSEDDAVEILNDGFMRIFTKIDTYNSQYPFKSWLGRIMVNTCINHYRKYIKNYKDLIVEEREYEEEAIHFDADENLRVEDLLSLLNGLPEVLKVTFNLYEIEGYSHKEIAEMLDINESSSRSNLTRAKSKLRTLYKLNFEQKNEPII